MVEKAESFIADYQEAFRAANPDAKADIRVQLWTPGWYRIANPGRDFDNKKYRRSEIIAMTERLRARVSTPSEASVPGVM